MLKKTDRHRKQMRNKKKKSEKGNRKVIEKGRKEKKVNNIDGKQTSKRKFKKKIKE